MPFAWIIYEHGETGNYVDVAFTSKKKAEKYLLERRGYIPVKEPEGDGIEWVDPDEVNTKDENGNPDYWEINSFITIEKRELR